jgi:N-methylhydantoinase A/oxoprolinase/acetone carboxylase beta subunit
MGIIALSAISEDAIILDIGGTTTDIAIFAQGTPLLDRDGAGFANRKTSIRAIKTASIGIGGDSLIAINKKGEITVGPQRQGAPLAFSGPAPTLIDACNVKGLCTLGDSEKSFSGFAQLAEKISLEASQLADAALKIALKAIHENCFQLLNKINQKPVYTVAEIIHGKKIEPRKLFVMGAPAQVLAPELEKMFQLETVVPENFAVANAVGAALTRPTMAAELFADTGKKLVLIPALDYKKEIDSSYSLAQAKEDLICALTEYLKINHYVDHAVPEIEVVTAEEFNMVDDYSIGSKSIRISCQIKPSLETDYLQGERK